MGFPRRLMLFMFGVGIGCLLVYGMLIRDREFPAWTPTDRVKEEITWDSIRIAPGVDLNMDQATLREAVNGADIHFDRSKVRDVPCRTYLMTTMDQHEMAVSICDSIATVVSYH